MHHSGKWAMLIILMGMLMNCNPSMSKHESNHSIANWPTDAISYSGFRAGQSPQDGIYPTQEQILEDLLILQKRWHLIRTYASDQHSMDVLEVIKQHNLDIKVMLGAYFAEEPGGEENNDKQIQSCIELVKQYPDVVAAVNIGNEALVSWSFLPVPESRIKHFVEVVRAAVDVPITVADNYAYWRDQGQSLAQSLDFVTLHTYPIWENLDIDQGLSYTIQNVRDVQEAIPGKPIVIGEAGWASFTRGNQHVRRAGDELKQKRYYEELTAWASENGIPVFWFEAFDEPWKGDGTEGHWGLFSEARTPKLAMHPFYPELVSPEPTSPEYGDEDGSTGPDPRIAFHEASRELLGSGSTNALGGWEDVVTVTAVETPGSSRQVIEMTHNGADWGGIFIQLDAPCDVSGFKTMEVELQLDPSISYFEIKLESQGGKGQVLNLMNMDQTELPSQWRRFSVPLKKMRGPDLTQLVMIGFWHPRDKNDKYVAGNIYIDQINFK